MKIKSCKCFADKTKTLAANNANTTSTHSASVAVMAPSVAGGQGAPTSPIKKVKENTLLVIFYFFFLCRCIFFDSSVSSRFG